MATPSSLENAASANTAQELKIALVGFGTVGSSVARIICEQKGSNSLRLTHVCNRNVAKKKVDWVPSDVVWTENIDDVLASDADVVVELMGGLDPAGDWIRRALKAGKSVVTANKKLIADQGTELDDLAHQMGRTLSFGASVAGGVPVLSSLQHGLAGDRLRRVSGVLNGTCNFILTKIESTGASFEQALKEAQVAGFAEADPTDDVDGFDARSKLVILARVGLNAVVRPEQVACQTIRTIEAVDFAYGHDLGCTVRQISRAELSDGTLLASVQPALVPIDSPLAHITGSRNFVISKGDFGGETAFMGHGAGGNPTAVAVVSDLLEIARERAKGNNGNAPAIRARNVSSAFISPYYLRFTVNDKPGIVATLSQILANHGINIDALFQRPGHAKSELPFVITLESCAGSKVEAALQDIKKLDFLVKPPLCMPILTGSL